MKELSSGAEAIILKDKNIFKKRIPKGYRIKELDDKIRKLRTRSEAKILDKLHLNVNVPKVINVNEKETSLEIEYINGKKLSEELDNFTLQEQEKIIKKIAKEVEKMHNLNIIHGDLTTSNMILTNELYLIDFGLGFHSSKIEDKAVDLHLFKQALESKHFKNWEKLFSVFVENYNPVDKVKIINQLKKVEARGRYKH